MSGATDRIVVVFSDADRHPLGTYWRFTAKKSDFYLEPVGRGSAGLHLSIHGPKDGFESHRFHIKVGEAEVAKARRAGFYVEHLLPRGGLPFSGDRVAEDAFRVTRMRWMPHLRDKAFIESARSRSAVPDLTSRTTGSVLSGPLRPTSVWDLDVFVAYDRPYWPPTSASATGNPRLGPLRNEAGMYLTVLSTQRAIEVSPNPDWVPDLPEQGQSPSVLLCGGPGHEDETYWWVETVVARERLKTGDG